MYASRTASPRRPRRRRFTATVCHTTSNAIEKKVILGYDKRGVHAHYEALGYVVLDVTPGDYRQQEFLAAAQGRGEGPWHIDPDALAEAKAYFGLTLPVEIRLNGRESSTSAYYRLTPKGGRCHRKGSRIANIETATRLVHEIVLKSFLGPERAGESLWHELTHAAQAERQIAAAGLGPDASAEDRWRARQDAHARENKGIGYERKPCEREARENERLNDACPLAVRA
jgi:hypothetical protein